MFRTEPTVETAEVLAMRDMADGSPAQMPVYMAYPAGPAGQRRPGVVLVQEIFGVNEQIRSVARRLAGMGFVVAAPDAMYRHGHWQTYAYSDFPGARAGMSHLNEDLVVGDVAAALDYLAGRPDVDGSRLGVMGFCFGGRTALVSAIRLPDQVKAAAVFYGGGIVSDAATAPVKRVGAIRCPVVAFFGAADQHIPEEHVRRLAGALDEAGVENRVYYYPGADHAFLRDGTANFHPLAAQDAWHRTCHFFMKNLGPVPGVEWSA
jgi:carboxymethylenebutenolidase